nr:MAG TPA: hypothetical protein [Caudoviricetes sp.]
MRSKRPKKRPEKSKRYDFGTAYPKSPCRLHNILCLR